MSNGTAISSGLITSSGTVPNTNGRGSVTAITAIGDGTNIATIKLFDGTDNSGVLLGQAVVVAGDYIEGGHINTPVRFTSGLYVEITGTGASAIIHVG